MSFTSFAFIAFIFCALIFFYILPKKCQWVLLLIMSAVFYCSFGFGASWWILVTTLTVYLATRRIDKNFQIQKAYLEKHKEVITPEKKKRYKAKVNKKNKNVMILCLVIDIVLLVVLKYSKHLPVINHTSILVPLGISYYTLQAIGYLVDVYKGRVKAEKNPFKVLLFLSFFPLIIQGPISRFGDLSKTLLAEHDFDWKNISFGAQRIMWGFFKKLVIAERLAVAVGTMIDDTETYHGAYAVLLMIFYCIDIYADFTGGIDITIGVAECFGVKLMENFTLPYFSTSLKEYWRRWHISMSVWFKTYVFYPLSVSSMMQKLTGFLKKHIGEKAGKRIPVYLSSLIVWILTGVWHGITFNFIAWGIFNWLVLMISEEMEPLFDKFHKKFAFSNTFGYKVFQIIRTLALLCVMKLFDCFASVGEIFRLLGSVITDNHPEVLANGGIAVLGLKTSDYIVIGVGVLTCFIVGLIQRSGSIREKIAATAYPVRLIIWTALFTFILIFGQYGIGYEASGFIYNKF